MKRGTKWLSALLTVTMLATGTGSFALAESTDGTTTQQEQVSTPEAGTEQKESAEIDQTAASAQEGEEKPTESGTDEEEPTDVGNTTPEEEAPAIELTELTLSSGAVSLEEGQSCTLSATANAGATLGEVTWTSSNADVASVSGGTVTGKAPGTATVTASCGNVSASCTVTVTAKTVAITGVSITGGADVVYADETTTFGYTYAPENADVSGVEWGVSDGSVATIANGLLTAHKPGSVTVTVTCTAPDGASVSAEKKVTVLRRATGIALSASSATLDVGGSAQLTATVTPADATDAVTWTSDNESVAQVDASGKVTAIGVGKANITVKCGEQSASCAVSVEKMPTAIELYTKTLTLYPGQVGTIRQTILPADATMKSLKWTSSNPAVATVSESGDVTGVAAGSCVITASTGNGISVSCSVTIVKQGQAVTSIKLNKSALSLVRTKTAKLKATVSPSKATDKGVIWLSSDPSIATVSSNGTVTGVKAGTVTITAFASNGMYKSCVVSVTPLAVSSVKMNKRSASLTFGATGQLTATVSPANADNTAVKWTSSNPAVVSVDESGRVTALKSGSATITAQTANGKKATCKVTVKGITVKLNKKSASLNMGATGQLTATLAATSAEYSKVTWTSSNPAVATVDANGLVTALKTGTATITATSMSGNKATCKVTVKGITVKLNSRSASLSMGGTKQLTATLAATSAEYSKVTWTSSNPAVASVDANGLVTALKSGTTTITATSVSGNKATCKVTVKGITVKLNKKSTSLVMGATGQLTATLSQTSAQYATVTWTSSNPAVATVDANGLVTALKTGTATITATSASGNKATCKVTVKGITVKLNKTKASVVAESTLQLTATLAATSAECSKVTWTSSNAAVATVSEAGLVTGVAPGTATITCTTQSGNKATCKVTVTPIKVTQITLENPHGTLAVGSAYALKATCEPANASNTALTWKSSSTKIATVDANGTVTALKSGTVTITATAKDGSKKSASIKLTIEPIDPSLFTLNTGSVTVKAGETSQITATLLGQLEGQQISWKTSNAAIAVVDGNGLITGIGSGTATISAAVSGLTRTVTVTVQPNTDVNYRVLIAGEYTNSSQSGYLKFAANGLNAVKSAFEMSNIDGARYEIMTLNNPSEAAVLNGIRDFFSDAKEGDVSVLYLLSHGTNTNGEYRWKIAGSTNYITEKELTSVLEGINGNVVLNLCSCYAGEYINDYTNAASTSLMNVVSTVNGYRSGNSKISIIAANTGYLDSCYTDTSAATSFDFFTRAFNEALGWDQQSKAAYEDGLHADANGDGKVTLLELATYVKEKVKTDIKEYVAQNGASSVKNSTAQDPQYYLTTPDLVVYARAKAQ